MFYLDRNNCGPCFGIYFVDVEYGINGSALLADGTRSLDGVTHHWHCQSLAGVCECEIEERENERGERIGLT